MGSGSSRKREKTQNNRARQQSGTLDRPKDQQQSQDPQVQHQTQNRSVGSVRQAKNVGGYHELLIKENSTNNSYETLFGKYLDVTVTLVEIEDPYIHNINQMFNLLRFCEMIVKSPAPVKTIKLATTRDHGNPQKQSNWLSTIKSSLKEYGVILNETYSSTLHDREIRFNNGWSIQIGRGLDYFQQPDQLTIGYCDCDLRKCRETKVILKYLPQKRPSLLH